MPVFTHLSHYWEKANVCIYIGKSFTNAGDLKMHELIYDGCWQMYVSTVENCILRLVT